MSTKEQVIVVCSCGRSIWWCTGDIETVSLIRRRLWTWNVLICLSHRTRYHTQTATTTAMHSQPLSLGYLVSAPVWSIFVDNHPSTGLLVVAITGIIYSRLHWLGELSKGILLNSIILPFTRIQISVHWNNNLLLLPIAVFRITNYILSAIC